MKYAVQNITELQIKLGADIAREIEHGAKKSEVLQAMARTLTDNLNTPTSAAWVLTFATKDPRTLAHSSYARVEALAEMLENNMSIWT